MTYLINIILKKWAPFWVPCILLLSLSLIVAGCGQKNEHQKVQTVHKTRSKHKPHHKISALAKRGLIVATSNGCFNCHSTNGKAKTGPTFKNLYKRNVTLKSGKTIIADTTYLKRAIMQPNAEITAGYYSVMPKYTRLQKGQVSALVAYIKALTQIIHKNRINNAVSR